MKDVIFELNGSHLIPNGNAYVLNFSINVEKKVEQSSP